MTRRCDTLVSFPVEKHLKFTKEFAKAIRQVTVADNSRYQIQGVVQHKNPNGNGGHYIAYCLNEEDHSWYKYDDNRVQEVKLLDQTDLYRDSYLLFYRKV